MISIVTICFGCATKHISSEAAEKLTEFTVPKCLPMKLDRTIIRDKEYKLLIPLGLQSVERTTSWFFKHQLMFKDSESVVILYLPEKLRRPAMRFNLSNEKFKQLIDEEDIKEELEDFQPLKSRRFGIRKIGEPAIYIIYLNVRPANIAAFNSAISSLSYN
ncbi:hypothetical protein IDJ77_01610 [Mucilaginibacter sp. ZT4R22]|uniref:Uncharacterized protein n=1 Tax=Mucilaginibacter pankratovii TaxID=2772110 RepID=A0ABR7WM84_9SPHI|nr:hypothetical protein [Mucilaginibacter pankratovii]MBD1362494.1 hypothetical protein [Mucilaginibacter pankratovii]